MLSLPWLIDFARFVWKTIWHLMMSQLAPTEKTGSYQRPESSFRNRIGSNDYPPQMSRYRLYVGLSCPWAHRTLIVRKLKGLEDAIALSLVIPSPSQGGWVMTEKSENCTSLKQLYKLSQPNYKGRCTVPVLWDSKTKTIVNNESSEIILLLNEQFNDFATNSSLNLYPPSLQEKIEKWNDKIYHNVNNGVYRCGFAQTQEAYETACKSLFATLDDIEINCLQNNRYLCSDSLTLADVRLFTTLIRFDLVYYGLFKCSLKRIADYPNLSRYLQDIYNLDGLAETCNFEIIKQDYYTNLFPLNPGGIVPLSSPFGYKKLPQI